MDLKDLSTESIAALASAASATLIGLGRVIYLRYIKRDESEAKLLADQQDFSQEREVSDRAEMLRSLREQIKRLEKALEAQDKRIQSLEGIIEKNNSEKMQHLTTIARLESRCEALESDNRRLRREAGLAETSEG